jgi:sugar lactone lactonase YvrE
MCLDAEGAIWTPAFKDGKPGCHRVAEGGEVLQRIELDAFCFACMLGGADGRTLHMLVAEWRGVERMGELFSAQTGQVLTARARAPHAGRP